METEGRKTEHGGKQPGTTDNVVPFPRDWLGPREELIPFGSSAGRAAEHDAVAPGAEAFWGGESDPLDAVFAAPAAPATVAGSRFRTRASQLAIGGLVASVLAAALLGRIAGAPTSGSGPTVGPDLAAAGLFDLGLLRGAVGAPVIKVSQPTARHVARRRAPAPVHMRHRTAVAAQRPRGSATRPVSSTGTSLAAASATSTSRVVTSTPTSTATSQSAATSSTPTHSSVSSHTASVRPGPVGPGAPFGPGQLK